MDTFYCEMDNELPALKYIDMKDESFFSRVRTILVVEDDSAVAESIAEMLEKMGHSCSICGRVDEALKIIQACDFDLMLVDYRLPEITGLDLILMLRQENCKVPVIMMTGYSATEDRLSTQELDPFTLLKKPLSYEQLASAVELAFNETARLPSPDGAETTLSS
jgi:DNA-binding response OmpR family regulator